MRGILLCQLLDELKARFQSVATKGALRSLEAGMEAIWYELENETSDDAYPGALRRLKTETNNLPTADRVQRILQEETKKARTSTEKTRLDRWFKTKGGETRWELDQAPSLFSRPQQIEMASDAVALLKRIPFLDKLERIQAQQELDEKYPGGTFALTQVEIRRCLTFREHWRAVEEAPPAFRRRHREERAQAERELLEAQQLGLL